MLELGQCLSSYGNLMWVLGVVIIRFSMHMIKNGKMSFKLQESCKAISSKFPNAGLKTCFQNFWEVLISYQKLWEFLGISGKYLEIPRCWTHSASSGISGQFPEFLGNARKFYEVLKSLGISGNFLEAPLCWTHLASFGKFWQFPEFLGRLRSSGNFWKVFGISGKCLEFPR